MDINALLYKHLKSENCMHFADNISTKYGKELLKIYHCQNNYSTDDILGVYENPMKLGTALVSSIRKKPPKAGILFLKDKFFYRENSMSEVISCCYSEIGNVYCSTAAVSIYLDSIENEIKLKGIGYAKPCKIADFFEEVYKNNANTFEVTSSDRRKKAINNTVDKILTVAFNLVEEGYEKTIKYEQDLNNYEEKLNKYEEIHGVSEKTREKRQQISTARKNLYNSSGRNRRSDSDFENSVSEADEGRPRDYQYRVNVPLCEAINEANSEPGVYILFLNGQVMKCGRAAYRQGVRWRLVQYYNLNYDNKARAGQYWSISSENRNNVRVSWQCCPASRCQELEFKLFKKYGKGPWANRAPTSKGNINKNSWDLLI